MASVLVERKSERIERKKKTEVISRVFALNKFQERRTGNIAISSIAAIFFSVVAVAFSGAFYLYQVNSIATKGFEIKKLENDMQELKRESQKLKIKEMELKSMYNIEKYTKDFNLVNSTDVIYLEINGPVAMK